MIGAAKTPIYFDNQNLAHKNNAYTIICVIEEEWVEPNKSMEHGLNLSRS
jgi:hypothetical protein